MSDATNLSAGDLSRSLGDAIKSNPLPAALIGAGLVWLLTGGRSSVKAGLGAASDGLAYVGSKGREALGGREQEWPGPAGATAQRRRESLDDTASSYGSSGPQLFASARSGMADLLEQQPLVLGAIGLGVGAAMAAAFRPTALEADWLGQTSANVQSRAKEIGAAAAGQAATVANKVTSAVADEARAQGLTPDAVKQSASDVSHKIESVVSKSADRLSQSRIS